VLRDFWAAQVEMGLALSGEPRSPVGPPAGHPERLAGAVALDAEERKLWADILGRSPRG
jgi:hypothetical protein